MLCVTNKQYDVTETRQKCPLTCLLALSRTPLYPNFSSFLVLFFLKIIFPMLAPVKEWTALVSGALW
jgi:hypothetical protein